MKSASVLHYGRRCASLTYMTATQHILTATRHKQVTHVLTHTTTFVPSRVACVAMCHTYIYVINISTGICPPSHALPLLTCTDIIYFKGFRHYCKKTHESRFMKFDSVILESRHFLLFLYFFNIFVLNVLYSQDSRI